MVIQQSRQNLIDYSIATNPQYVPNWHHRVIAHQLEKIAEHGDRDYKILIVTVPPRHGKSQECSIDFPSWYLGKNPNKEIITASYAGELAQSFGGKAREKVDSPAHKLIFPEVSLKEDEKAKGRWRTNLGGSYLSVGVGGPITGFGANCLLIDDPTKNREEAESSTMREKVWDWFTSTAFTRLSPNGVVVLIMCMTGDTPVLMADGTERALRDIRQGDKVATYDKGKLATSTVQNWQNNGLDRILKIKTTSGKIVRSNKRHPFLTYFNGELKWTRAQNLTTAYKIVTVRGSGENGKGKSALSATYQSLAEDTVLPTMAKKCGLMDIVRRQLIRSHVVKGGLRIATALRLRNITSFLRHRMDDALFVMNHQEKMCVLIGEENSVLTTATTPIKSEDFSVMTVILRSVMQKLKLLLLLLRNTSNFTLEDIVSIEEDGVEDVFDIQIERTENFIANGVVSHNTRWHMDDLAGRILAHPTLSKRTKLIRLPAIAEKDDKFRKAGEPLWPTRYDLASLEEIKKTIGPYDWAALYQGSPILTEDQEFRTEWIKTIDEDEVESMSTTNYLTVDTAMSKLTQSDSCGFCDNSVDKENFWNIAAWGAKLNPEELVDTLFALHEKRKYTAIGLERTMYTDGLKPFLESEQRRRNRFLPIVELKHNQTAKEIRIRGLIPRYASGSIRHIKGRCKALEEEQAYFPNGLHDDVLDATAYQSQIVTEPESTVYIHGRSRKSNLLLDW